MELQKPTHLNVIVDVKHYEALIVGLANLEAEALQSYQVDLAYVYAKFSTQLIMDFHRNNLCHYDKDKCPLDDTLKEFRDRYKLNIEKEFHQLINSNKNA